MLPDSENSNFYSRLTKKINADTEAFVEFGLSTSRSRVQGGGANVALVPSGGYFLPNGNVVSQTAVTQLGASHPDNPYFGTAARLSYNPIAEIGPRTNSSSSRSVRLLGGLKGTMGVWDYDAGFQFSESKQKDTAEKVINWRVSNALLNPTAANVAAAAAFSPAYAALPAGTVWRIGENAGLNSPAMYAALLADKSREGYARSVGFDFKATRELGFSAGVDIREGLRRTVEWTRDHRELIRRSIARHDKLMAQAMA